jgi:hypothetical protein
MLMWRIASDASSSSCSEHSKLLLLLLLLLLAASPLLLLVLWEDSLSDTSSAVAPPAAAGHATLNQLLPLLLLLSSMLQVLGGVMLPWRLQAAAAFSSFTTAGSALCQLRSRWLRCGVVPLFARHVGSEPDSLQRAADGHGSSSSSSGSSAGVNSASSSVTGSDVAEQRPDCACAHTCRPAS